MLNQKCVVSSALPDKHFLVVNQLDNTQKMTDLTFLNKLTKGQIIKIDHTILKKGEHQKLFDTVFISLKIKTI